MMSEGSHGAGERHGTFAQTMRAVAWSFIGIRRRAGQERDAQRLNPVHVVLGGLAGVALFVTVLVLLVRWVVHSGIAA